MAAHEETTQRAVFVDTSNEPRTDEEAVSMCTQGLERATAPQDIADLQFRLANAQVRRGFELVECVCRRSSAHAGAVLDEIEGKVVAAARAGGPAGLLTRTARAGTLARGACRPS